jgi:hypothetical protein
VSIPETHRPLPPVTPVVRPTTHSTGRRKERGVTLRLLAYVVVAHLLALYLYVMFAVIGKH